MQSWWTENFKKKLASVNRKRLILDYRWVQMCFCLNWAFVHRVIVQNVQQKKKVKHSIADTKTNFINGDYRNKAREVQWTMINDHLLVAIKHRTHKFFVSYMSIFLCEFLYRFFVIASSKSKLIARREDHTFLRPTTTKAHYLLESF